MSAPTGSPANRFTTTCPSGERGYHDKKGAKAARKRIRQPGLTTYRCNLCPLWHVGTMPAHVRAGDEARAVLVTLPRRPGTAA